MFKKKKQVDITEFELMKKRMDNLEKQLFELKKKAPQTDAEDMNKEEMADYLRMQIEICYTTAIDESHRDFYRIRCYGMAKGFQMSLAMLTGELEDIKPIKIKGELIR